MDYLNGNSLILYFCGYERCSPSHSFGPAIRPHYLIHFIVEGQGIYYVNGKEHRLSAGHGFLITPGKNTYYIADSKNPWEYYWIGFDGYEAKTILDSCGLSETDLIFYVEEEGLRTNFMELNYKFNTGDGNLYTYISYLYKIFSYMVRTTRSNVLLRSDTYLEQALAFINHNYIYDIKITDVAKSIGIDRTYLFKLFKEGKKISPQQYLINFRLQTACRYLKDTKLTATEIAYSCGFKDTSSFNKLFKKHYSLTPIQYRYEIKRIHDTNI